MSGKHLTRDDRIRIDKYLTMGRSIRQIAGLLHVAHTTVARKVVKHRVFAAGAEEPSLPSACIRAATCRRRSPGCRAGCADFVARMACGRLNRAPFVCNACGDFRSCRKAKMSYVASAAEEEYRATLSESRSGVDLTPEELEDVRECTADALRRGQSPYHIVQANRDRIPVSVRTIYRLVEGGLLDGLRKSNLKRAAGMRPRKGRKPQRRIERECCRGRTYDDYKAYVALHPETRTVEMDTVLGTRGGRCLLTMHIPVCMLQLMFIRRRNDAASVIEWFDWLERTLGLRLFRLIFPIVLTDNGSEFSDPTALERSVTGEGLRTRIFYCDPYSASQKGCVEGANEYMRDVFPKGRAIPDISQERVARAASHINSKIRQGLDGRTSIALFRELFGAGTLALLGLREIPAKDVTLTPSVLD